MDLSLSPDQVQVLDAIDSLVKPYSAAPLHDTSFALTSPALDDELAQAGFFDILTVDELGVETASLVIERLARLPFAIEAAASTLVRPLIDLDLPRPWCLVEEGREYAPVRFLAEGATIVLVGPSGVRSFSADASHIRATGDEMLFAYPMAFLEGLPAEMARHDVPVEKLLARWRAALAAEAAGLLAAALDSVVTHVSERRQFGRPIGTFQAVRHRLAEAEVAVGSLYWLALRAAATGTCEDAAMAAFKAQDAIKQTVYDYHQFLGAMGMTLEHPLHLWTYRAKALLSELGGRGEQALAAADALWGPVHN